MRCITSLAVASVLNIGCADAFSVSRPESDGFMRNVLEVDSVLDESDNDTYEADDGAQNETQAVASKSHTLPNQINMKLGFAERPSQALFEPMPINASVDDLKQSTQWKQNLDRPDCQKKIMKLVDSSNSLFCRSHARILWSPQYKFAYMKTPKAADIAFERYFYAQFLDTQELGEDESLPEDVYLFTFVRDPFDHALAGYQAVDHHLDDIERSAGQQDIYSFRKFPLKSANERYERFLQALEKGSFGGASDKVDHKTAATQLSGIICQTSAKAINFIGHLENLETDWRVIQHMAGVPMKLRTAAIQVTHQSKKDADVSLQVHMLSPGVYDPYCRIYRIDYRCLGYDLPVACSGTPDSHDLEVPVNFTIGGVSPFQNNAEIAFHDASDASEEEDANVYDNASA